MFCFDVSYLMCFILLEAIAASAVCHQRNAICGRGASIFVLTHFAYAKRHTPRQVQRKNTMELIGKVGTVFLFGDALEADAVADEGGTRRRQTLTLESFI
jgi:hypothetical protein